jgi:hypothetical protein
MTGPPVYYYIDPSQLQQFQVVTQPQQPQQHGISPQQPQQHGLGQQPTVQQSFTSPQPMYFFAPAPGPMDFSAIPTSQMQMMMGVPTPMMGMSPFMAPHQPTFATMPMQIPQPPRPIAPQPSPTTPIAPPQPIAGPSISPNDRTPPPTPEDGALRTSELTCFACRGVGHKATQCPTHPRPIVPTPSADVIVTCAIHGKPRTSKNMFYNNQVGVWQCFSETACKNLS